jgi:hypothetical protein
MSLLRRAPLAVVTATLLALMLLPAGVGPSLAAEYTLQTKATYQVQPDDRAVAVSVGATFENTTPDPAGQFSVFEVVDLAVHPGATDIAAKDAKGDLEVTTDKKQDFTLVSVHPRQPVRYQATATFTLTYTIPDAAAAGIRVRPSLVAFPAWSFGTAGTVAVTIADSYEVSVDGSEMSVSRRNGNVTLTADVDDPANWLAQIVAAGPSSFQTHARAVPLNRGTVDLQVKAWADDEAWGTATLDLLAAALPLLEQQIGLPYPGIGPLVVVESVTNPAEGIGEPSAEGTQLVAAYDQPSFTIVHQAAHAWFSERLASDRWMREGFASLAAAAAASQLDEDAPYDPAARSDELSDAAFPLVSWGAGDSSEDQDAWAYAASWAVAQQVGHAVGPDALQRAWQRIAAEIGPYDSVPDDQPLPEHVGVPNVPADSRALLDQLEAVSDADVAAIFRTTVFDADTGALLDDRAAARAELDALAVAADGWGIPDPVKVDLVAWRFDGARQRIAEGMTWLAERDRLTADAAAAGLIVPQRLRDRYRTAGGGQDAQAELEAERAVVDAYGEVLSRANDDRGPLERIGLLGGPEPSSLLSDANGLFGQGELRGAADAIAAARLRLDHAATDGAIRLVAAVLVSVILLFIAYRLVRRSRPREGSGYTAAR